MLTRKNTNCLAALRFCLVTNIQNKELEQYSLFIKQAVLGGVSMVQLREKGISYDLLRKQAVMLKKNLAPFNVPLIINDNVELACEVDANGVHLGQTDMHPEKARKLLGPNKIIGWSLESLDDVHRSNSISCLNYVTASAIFASKIKPDCKMHWGLDGLKTVVNLSKHPVTAIGGITVQNAQEIMNHGAKGVAVIGAVHDYEDAYFAALKLSNELDIDTADKKRVRFK